MMNALKKATYEVTVGLQNKWNDPIRFVTFKYSNVDRYEAISNAESDATVFPFINRWIANVETI